MKCPGIGVVVSRVPLLWAAASAIGVGVLASQQRMPSSIRSENGGSAKR